MSLKKNEIKKYQEILLDMRNQILKTVKGTSDEVKEADKTKGYSQHQADEGTDDFVQNINLEVTNSGTTLLKQIDRALEKIEEGTYGICDLSKEEIPRARLDAIPYATMTVEAQEKLEKGK